MVVIDKKEMLRKIPAVDRLLDSPALIEASSKYPRSLIIRAINQVLDGIRKSIVEGDGFDDTSTPSLAESEPTLASCTSACSGVGCCEVNSVVCDTLQGDGFFVTSTLCGGCFSVEGPAYYCRYILSF